MAIDDDLAAWHGQLVQILEATADAMRKLGIARASAGLSSSVHEVAADSAEATVDTIAPRVRRANELALRLVAADPTLAEVVHPLLEVPGAAPIVDLRPWWSRLLQKVSGTASRASVVERLETLRLEADAALLRASGALSRPRG